MPRISAEVAAAKQSFVLGLFADNPSLSMKEVQDKVKAQFGGAMNAVKVLELKHSLLNKDSPIVVSNADSTTTFVTPTTEVLTVNHVEEAFTAPVVAAIPAPQPISVVPPEVTETNTKVMEQVTTSEGTFVREPQPQKQGEEVQIVKGLVEIK